MASRDIANMHVFLDLKKKFPDLPDETLRSYVSLFAEDQEKCLRLLQKESKRHYHPSQPFPDFRLPENKVNSVRSDYVKHFAQDLNEGCLPNVNLQHLYIPTNNKSVPVTAGRSSSHAGVVHLPQTSLNQNTPFKPGSLSAPVINSSERPFKTFYKQNSVSSQTPCQSPSNRNNQFIFQTTKNHIIEVPETHESTTYLSVSGEPEQSRKHAVTLSITPSLPFHQQHINVYNNAIYTTALHSPRLDRHTTSVNFQLQPQASSQFPIEISTIPTNIGQPCDSKDFCSHVQISVGEQGTTFTAVRLQRPNYSQTENAPPLSVAETFTPSQAQNSSPSSISDKKIQHLPSSFEPPASLGLDQNQNAYISRIQPNIQMSSVPNYQLPHFLTVKNQQIAQLDLILNELEKEKSICSQLRTEVSRLEEELSKKNAATPFPYEEELQKLREEIKSLRVDVSCLTMEVDSAGENLPRSPPKSKSLEDDDNQWHCKNCTFANHPALEKCEMCELPKNSDSVQSNPSCPSSTHFQLTSSTKPPPRRAVGSIQISVTRRIPASNSIKLELTHRLPR